MNAAKIRLGLLLLLGAAAPGAVRADPAPFDLTGPTLRVSVTRGGATLPIAQVPDLAAGDRLAIRADLPADQSTHYLLVAAFLRGATNPPPEKWFFQSEPWTKKGRTGLDLTVPEGAQQIVLFLAPETGGDFGTIKDAVRGKPGAFVRASQDLNQATLDHARLDTFLAALRKGAPGDPDRIETIAPKLTRTLAIKLNTDCLQKMPELQAACLMQNQESLVLNDGHSSAISDAVVGGADLALQLSATPQGGLGYYSPYIAAIRDVIGIFASFHTAKYQYIPGLKREAGDGISLLLNAPPSFHNPKSVLVTALPAIAPPKAPPLQAADSNALLCAARGELVLPVSGAPLTYATDYAHGLALRLTGAKGTSLDLPATPDAEKGGFVIATAGSQAATLQGPIEGALHGRWGFQPFDGPHFRLQTPRPGAWKIADADQRALIVGREGSVTIEGGAAACVDAVLVKQGDAAPQPVEWKAARPDALSVALPLKDARAGPVSILVRSAGIDAPEAIAAQAYAEASRIDGLDLHAGDRSGVLRGSRLDAVDTVSIGEATYRPAGLARAGNGDELRLAVADGAPVPDLKPGQALTARIAYRDGRTASVRATVGAARPGFDLVAKAVQRPADTTAVRIALADADALPRDARLAFSLRAANGGRFTGRETVEVALADGSASTTLGFATGLTLQDAQIVVASLDTARAFNASAFGPLRYRVLQDGTASDWQPLATLVRLPALRQITCPPDTNYACQLIGEDMFLIASVAGNPAFDKAVEVPQGYPGNALQVPRPTADTLYLKLRDAPAIAATIVAAGKP